MRPLGDVGSLAMRSYFVLSLGLTLSSLLGGCATGGDPFSTGGNGTGGSSSNGGGGDGGDPSNGGNSNVTTDDTTTTKTATVTSTSTNTSTGSMGCSGFQCANGQCINAAQECDNTVHCADGSDEAPYNAACPSTNTTSTGTGGGACDPFFEFTCNSGECLPIFFVCDGGLLDCGDGSDEDAALCGSGGGAPPEWTCDPTYYDAADGCDCGCGAIDLDCASSNVDACDYCDNSGSCSATACPGDVDPTNNAICP
jgi:hypothetical protein